MLTQSGNIAAMASAQVAAVLGNCIFESLRLMVGTFCKPVGHYQIKHVGRVETRIGLAGTHTLAELILDISFLIAILECQFHNSRLRIFAHHNVKQQIVRTVKAHRLRQAHAGMAECRS